MGRISALALGLLASGTQIAAEEPAAPPAPETSAAPTGPPPAPFQPSSLPAATFARLPFVENPALSPGGRRLAGFLAIEGKQTVAIINLFDVTEQRHQIRIPEGTQASSVRWVNDDNILVGLVSLLGIPEASERWYISRVIGINRITGKITKLLWDSGQNAADVLWMPSDGSNEVLLAAQGSIYSNYPEFSPTVYRVDVATARKRTVLKGHERVMNWEADASGQVQTGMRYAEGSRQFSLLYCGEGSSGSFRTIDRADSRKQEKPLRPFLFLPGTDHALALHEDDAGRSGIFEVDLLTRGDVRTVFTAPEGVEVAGITVSDDGKQLLGVWTSAADGPVHWLDPALAALQAQFDKASATGGRELSA